MTENDPIAKSHNVLDLNGIDTTPAAGEGVWFRPTDPEGTPLAFEILVYGEDSRQYTAAMDKIARTRKTRAKARRATSVDVDYSDIKEAGIILASRLTGGLRYAETLEPVTKINVGGQFLDPQKASDLEALYGRLTDLADQVVVFARDSSHFLQR